MHRPYSVATVFQDPLFASVVPWDCIVDVCCRISHSCSWQTCPLFHLLLCKMLAPSSCLTRPLSNSLETKTLRQKKCTFQRIIANIPELRVPCALAIKGWHPPPCQRREPLLPFNITAPESMKREVITVRTSIAWLLMNWQDFSCMGP